jgi:hypothetical protein
VSARNATTTAVWFLTTSSIAPYVAVCTILTRVLAWVMTTLLRYNIGHGRPRHDCSCVLPWQPRDRKRRVLMLRFQPQYLAAAYRLFDSGQDGSNGWERGEQSNGCVTGKQL